MSKATPHQVEKSKSSEQPGHWLVKQEPSAYSWEQFAKDGKTDWTGVRNFQARNFLREMRVDDPVLFYHSVAGKEVVGVAVVTKTAFPDPTANEGDWSSVELTPVKVIPHPVTLQAIKNEPSLSGIGLLKQSRLSVMPLTGAQFQKILEMGGL